MSRNEPMQRRTVVRGMVKEAQDHEVALRTAKRAARRSWFALPVVPRMR
ncbi:MAG: hypothetical protein ACTHLT_17835 [Devosia sp.]